MKFWLLHPTGIIGIFVVLRLLLTCALLLAAADPKELYLQAVKGDRDAAREAEKLYASRRDDAVALAYLGSLHILESGRTMALWKKGRLAKDGLTALDTAVNKAPDNLEVRYLRAMSTMHLPAMFGREQQCAEDFTWLAARVEREAAAGRFDPRYAASALEQHRRISEKRR